MAPPEPGAQHEHVDARAAGQRVAPGAAVKAVITTRAIKNVIPGATFQNVVAVAGIIPAVTVPGTLVQFVAGMAAFAGADIAKQYIGTITALHKVIAHAAAQFIGSCVTNQRVITARTDDVLEIDRIALVYREGSGRTAAPDAEMQRVDAITAINHRILRQVAGIDKHCVIVRTGIDRVTRAVPNVDIIIARRQN